MLEDIKKKYKNKILELAKELIDVDDNYEYELVLKDEIKKYQEFINDLDKYQDKLVEDCNYKKITKDEIKDYIDTDYCLLDLITFNKLESELKKFKKHKLMWEELKKYSDKEGGMQELEKKYKIGSDE